MSIYEPKEDSYLLNELLINLLKSKKTKDIKILDMGSGLGIFANTCKSLGFNNLLAVDINLDSVRHLKNLGLKSIKSDLFLNIEKNKKFDLIIFNPPYLPFDKKEEESSRIATSGGKKGYEIILKFLNQAKNYLNKNGEILLLFSSLSKPRVILDKAKKLGFNYQLINKKKLFFEELYVYRLTISL
jgi:release factor glutamine methyltransferase